MAATAEQGSAFGGRSEFYDLAALAEARRLGDWSFAKFAPAAHGRVAEVGPGIGTFSERLLDRGVEELLLVEPFSEAARFLEERYADDPRVRVTEETLPGAESLTPESFDFVLCQNVLEHIEDDRAAAAEMGRALVPGGTLGLLVPAHPRLYSALDDAYGHHRRYTRDRLRSTIAGAGLDLVELRSFNLLGVAGWWAKKMARSTTLDMRSLRAYEQLVRAWRPVEDRLRPPWGLSLIALARRPA